MRQTLTWDEQQQLKRDKLALLEASQLFRGLTEQDLSRLADLMVETLIPLVPLERTVIALGVANMLGLAHKHRTLLAALYDAPESFGGGVDDLPF